jgi:hypothetical protein
MGQYYKVINVSKKEYIHPHNFGDGMKLMEFGCSGQGTMTALALLLSSGNGRGGGDMRSGDSIIGSWAGDNIVIAGDYDDAGKYDDLEVVDKIFCRGATCGVLTPAECQNDNKDSKNLYTVAEESYKNISVKVLKVMLEDEWLRNNIEERVKDTWEGSALKKAYDEACK